MTDERIGVYDVLLVQILEQGCQHGEIAGRCVELKTADRAYHSKNTAVEKAYNLYGSKKIRIFAP